MLEVLVDIVVPDEEGAGEEGEAFGAQAQVVALEEFDTPADFTDFGVFKVVSVSVDEFLRSNYEPEKLYFARPDDGKSFAGEVLRFAECQEWLGRLKAIENSDLSGKRRIIVGEPFSYRK